MRATLRLSSPAWFVAPNTTWSTARDERRRARLRAANDVRREVVGAHGREAAAVPADRRADGVDEIGRANGQSSRWTQTWPRRP